MNKIVITYQDISRKILLQEGQKLIIGRVKNGSHSFVVDHALVSKQHISIENIGGQLFVADLGSTNGTLINNSRISAEKKYPLASSDHIYLAGNNVCTICLANAVPDKAKEKVPLSSSVNDVKSTTYRGLSALLSNKDQIIIGRSNECDVVINDASISRKHARVWKEKGGYFVEDLGSTNGTYINQLKVRSKTKLRKGNLLFIGLTAFSIDEDVKDFSKEVAIQTIEVSKKYKNGYVGLHPITLSIQGREMVALMGPSGCGKSTLLKALNGDSPASTGQVHIFGLELSQNYSLLKQKIGYVPQDDIVHGELSVLDTLYYAAKLRLEDRADETFIQERITDVLTSLNINDPVIRKAKVASLSGGQRKRISIAVELLNKPSILFLDEPTSPLDPETIEEFLKCLKKLCAEGTTVVMVTHKPEDLYFVDKIVFLGTKGYHVFEGKQDQFLTYFKKNNIVEVYSLLNSETYAKEWYRKWYASSRDQGQIKTADIHKDNDISLFRQFFWLSRRYLHIRLSNPKNLALQFFQPILIAILLRLVFTDLLSEQMNVPIGTTSIVFMMSVAAIWFGVSNSAKEIIGEKAIFRRERMFNLVLGNYFLSKWIILSFIAFIQLTIFLGILKLAYGNDMVQFMPTLGFLLLISSSAIIFGLLLSSLSGSTEEVMSIMPLALLPQIILAGIFTPLQNKFTEFCSYLTLGRWGTEGLARLQDKGRAGAFLSVIDENLYNENLAGWFDSLGENILVMVMLNMVMIAGIFLALKRMEKSEG